MAAAPLSAAFGSFCCYLSKKITPRPVWFSLNAFLGKNFRWLSNGAVRCLVLNRALLWGQFLGATQRQKPKRFKFFSGKLRGTKSSVDLGRKEFGSVIHESLQNDVGGQWWTAKNSMLESPKLVDGVPPQGRKARIYCPRTCLRSLLSTTKSFTA